MTSRDRMIKTLNFEDTDRVPRDLWYLPAVAMFQSEEKKALVRRYPLDISRPSYEPGISRVQEESSLPRCIGGVPSTPRKGERYIDEWGCVFYIAEDGVMGEVREPRLQSWDKLDSFKPPWESLDKTNLESVNGTCMRSDKFTLSDLCAHPFERVQYLRGTENLFKDLIKREKKVKKLLEIVHNFNLERIRMWLDTDVDGIMMMDDWGAENGLLISPRIWRKLLKPLYREYCKLIHDHNKYVFFHSDGYIEELFPDIIEIGVDALNSQLFIMDISKIIRKYRGVITFWGEIDRRLLAFGSPKEVAEAVYKVRSLLDAGQGGVIAQCEWGKNSPYENIEAVFDAWAKPGEYII